MIRKFLISRIIQVFLFQELRILRLEVVSEQNSLVAKIDK